MQLIGDPDGIAVLKGMKQNNREYLKFIIGEANSNTIREAEFKGPDDTRYKIKIMVPSGDLEVSKI